MYNITIPVKLTKTSGSPHLFKFTGTLNSEDIKLNKKLLMGYTGNKLG